MFPSSIWKKIEKKMKIALNTDKCNVEITMKNDSYESSVIEVNYTQIIINKIK